MGIRRRETQRTLFDAPGAVGQDRPCPAWEKSIEPGPGCRVCGSLEEWIDGLGRTRCGACDADVLANARRLMETAAQLRN